ILPGCYKPAMNKGKFQETSEGTPSIIALRNTTILVSFCQRSTKKKIGASRNFYFFEIKDPILLSF
ncbi:MAG: hypothetical protein QXQ38_01070, partial [Archaeoglobaceae archaeon]